jgi:hypothetical protein
MLPVAFDSTLRVERTLLRQGRRSCAALVALTVSSLLASEPEPAAIQSALRASRLRTEAAVEVRDLHLDAGLAELRLEEGTLFPASAVAGRPAEMVFVGRGRLAARPPDDVEAWQLELFTGRRELDATFQEAVLVVASDAAAAQLLGGPTAHPAAPQARQAEALFASWLGGPHRRLLHVEGHLLLDALGDPRSQGYFVAHFQDADLGEILYVVEPDEPEPVTLGQFVPLGVSRREARRLRRSLHAAQEEGWLLGLDVEDLGTWDTWMSTALPARDGDPVEGSAFEPTHYDLELVIEPKTFQVSGATSMTLESTSAGSRGIKLHLDRNLEVRRITDDAGRDLAFSRQGAQIIVALESPVEAGATVTLRVEYAGKGIEEIFPQNIVLSTTTDWYPRTGTLGQATYDVLIEYPADRTVVASGAAVDLPAGESGNDASGRRRARFRQERPVKAFTFEIGDLTITHHEVGHVALTVALHPDFPGWVREQVFQAAAAALGYYETVFGPYPLDHLTIVSAPRGYSQGLLGLVSLSFDVLNDADNPFNSLLNKADRRTVIAHEIAHQWWGNLVDWRGYRDQWLSEAMANYAALLFTRDILHGDVASGREIVAGWRAHLSATTASGRTIESLGPIALGRRLDSSQSDDAYSAIVYEKGAVVLDMLAQVLGEDRFLKMLGQVARHAAGRVLSTQEFLAALSHMSGENLDWFAGQYVYGTGLPDVDYSFGIEHEANGAWTVKGEARQRATYRYRYGVRRTSSGSWDIVRERFDRLSVEDSRLVVPVGALVRMDAGRQAMLGGTIQLAGARSTFQLRTEHEPLDFVVDPAGRMLANFHCENRRPKHTLLLQGIDLVASGQVAEAEATLGRALQSPVLIASGPLPGAAEIQREDAFLDGMIHLQRARLFLDQDRDEEAADALSSGRKVLDDRNLDANAELLAILEARLDLHRGATRAALKRLREVFPPDAGASSTEGITLLAIAAHQAGSFEESARASALATRRGADLSALTAPPR